MMGGEVLAKYDRRSGINIGTWNGKFKRCRIRIGMLPKAWSSNGMTVR
jgi:hypothetical protein